MDSAKLPKFSIYPSFYLSLCSSIKKCPGNVSGAKQRGFISEVSIIMPAFFSFIRFFQKKFLMSNCIQRALTMDYICYATQKTIWNNAIVRPVYSKWFICTTPYSDLKFSHSSRKKRRRKTPAFSTVFKMRYSASSSFGKKSASDTVACSTGGSS